MIKVHIEDLDTGICESHTCSDFVFAAINKHDDTIVVKTDNNISNCYLAAKIKKEILRDL